MLCRKTVFNTSSTKRESAKEPIIKRKASTPSAAVGTSNFLLQGAKKAKALRSARTAARVGCNHAPSTENSLTKVTTNNRLSNTGTGIPLSEVIRLKYVKGFTQAVSMPCRLEDIS
jgi:chromosome transmission fidelity protein 18